MNLLNLRKRTKGTLRFGVLWSQVGVLLAGLLSPLMLFSGTVSADQVTSRSLLISTSKASSTTANYTVSFTTPATTNIGSIILQACTTPLSTCSAPTGLNINLGTTGTWTGTSATNFTRTTSTTGGCTVASNQWCGTRTAASETAGAKSIALTNLTNPSVTGSFFIRITTYSDAAYATSVDTGVVAGAITNQLTVNARIQEILNFCVGTTLIDDSTTTPGSDCSAISGSTIDIGVLDASTINISPVSTNGGTNTNGIAMVRTNAQNGVVVSYYSEQNNGSGTLKVAGASCSGTSTTDQCINAAGTTKTAFVAGTEKFGMTVAGINCVSTTSYTCVYTSGTNNLKQVTDYTGGANNTTYGNTGYAWDATGTVTTIATSASSTLKVVDDEAIIMKFAATPSITTPTGAYTVVSTYVATATY